ncbi:MAG: diacylglycerol kinase family protein [Bacteroidota bacterium]|nr:diacylglycerol kinase family protein [Bacteroidota bacterium]
MKKGSCINKALFILNPYAGIPPVKFIVTKELSRRRHELSYYKSLSIDESGSLIKNNFDKYDVFIAAGGDGTVHTVATELIGSEKKLGVLPIGSGNGFARELGFRPNIRSLLNDIEKGECLDIDVLQVNDNLCLNVTGIGLDSFVAHSFDRLKTRGFWSYVGVTLLNFLKLKPFNVKISIPGEETISEDLFVLTFANNRQFGNNAFIAPEAVPNDGKMDIVMIRPFPKALFFVFVYRLFTKKLHKSAYVKYLRTDKDVTVRTSETRFHIDGEPVWISGDVCIRIQKEALKVLRTKHLKKHIII